MQTITPERSLIYETVHLPYKLVISRRIWEFGKITVCEPALFFQRAAVPNDALPSDHAVSVIPQCVGSGSAGLSHKAAGWMASVILSEPWPQPRFSLLLPYFYIWVCHFNWVDKNQNCAYTLNPTQVKFGTRKMLTFGNQRVILTLLCKSILSHRGIFLVRTYAFGRHIHCWMNCVAANGAAFFVRGFGCAFFIFKIAA